MHLPCTGGSRNLRPKGISDNKQSKDGASLTSRPARPARCIADDLVISLVRRVSNPAEI